MTAPLPLDQLVAIDDLLTGRLQSCTCCGAARPSHEGMWRGETPGAVLVVACVLCERCQGASETRTTLDAKLGTRYGVPEDEGDPQVKKGATFVR